MGMIKVLLWIVIIAVWIYILFVLKRTKIYYGYFIVGCFGLFIISMILFRPVAVKPLARCVAAIAGLFGNLTGTFTAFFKYGILFIETAESSITLQIDFECSGIIEILAFVSLLAFFQVYNVRERILVGVLGCAGIIMANVLRIIVICELIHFIGVDAYYVSHALVGRLVFYVLSVLLYFYVFTKPQIVRTKLGKFSYGRN